MRPGCWSENLKFHHLGYTYIDERDFQQISLAVADQTHLAQRQEFFKITMQLITLLRNILPNGIRQNIVCIVTYFVVGLIENT